jgi:hypothetical protein
LIDFYSKKSIKLEDGENVVAWSNQEQDAPAANDGDDVMEDDSRFCPDLQRSP